MRIFRWLIGAAALVAAAVPASAQGKLDAEVLKLYGGIYSSECGNASAPRLRVVANALMVEQGNKRLRGGERAGRFFLLRAIAAAELPSRAGERAAR
ncbi:MAG: hypothetical protein Q8S00_02065 [Deltaproteobacteria bacterium]|nr:hypothetical protein [Deltaproteobacteria bacterium]MDZ4343731.1 hypothetical protein [Candidatus Binatia bacterium]